MKKSIVLSVIVLGIALIVGGGIYYHRQQAVSVKRSMVMDTVDVRRMDLSEKIEVSGKVVMESSPTVTPPYSAIVKKILVKPGEYVRKGDVMFILQVDDNELQERWAGWKSSLSQSRLNLETAKRALERQEVLYRIQGTTIDELENAQSKVRQYEEQCREYELKLASLTQSGVILSEDQSWDIHVRAPFDAMVSWVNVKLEQSVTTSTELIEFGGDEHLLIEVEVDQGDINQIKEGLPVLISANDKDRTMIPGKVISFGSTGTESSNVVTFPVHIKPLGFTSEVGEAKRPVGMTSTPVELKRSEGMMSENGKSRRPFPPKLGGDPESAGTKPVRMPRNLQNKEKPDINSLKNLLKIGMSVDVMIIVENHPNVLAIPRKAVMEDNGKAIVKVLVDGKPEIREVQLGYKGSKYIEVLSGLNEGDKIVLPEGSPRLFSGSDSMKNGPMRNRNRMMGPPPM